MLLVDPQGFLPHTYYMDCRLPTPPSGQLMFDLTPVSMESHHPPQDPQQTATPPPDNNEVAQALEIARESPDGANDPVISNILETALAQIWSKVQARPDSYVMSRDEFAVFNFFQHRFMGNDVATAARRRYWDNSIGG